MYTLDPQDADAMENCNDAELARMKKYVDAVIDVMLTERQRQVVWMRHGEGRGTAEIAEELGISMRRVQAALSSGMKKLNKQKKIFIKSV